MRLSSVLRQTRINSKVDECGVLMPKGNVVKKTLVAGLMLTSLVDAFSILVIYLLMSYSSSGEILFISKDMVLPDASNFTQLERNTVVKYEQGKYFVEEAQTDADGLTAALLKVREEFTQKFPNEEFQNKIVIQADKDSQYINLNSIIHAGSQAGFEEIKFAVLSN